MNYFILFSIYFSLGEPERKKKEVIKRKEDVHAAKDHLKDLLLILASVWENKKVDVNVDSFTIFYFILMMYMLTLLIKYKSFWPLYELYFYLFQFKNSEYIIHNQVVIIPFKRIWYSPFVRCFIQIVFKVYNYIYGLSGSIFIPLYELV